MTNRLPKHLKRINFSLSTHNAIRPHLRADTPHHDKLRTTKGISIIPFRKWIIFFQQFVLLITWRLLNYPRHVCIHMSFHAGAPATVPIWNNCFVCKAFFHNNNGINGELRLFATWIAPIFFFSETILRWWHATRWLAVTMLFHIETVAKSISQPKASSYSLTDWVVNCHFDRFTADSYWRMCHSTRFNWIHSKRQRSANFRWK